ncbi:MAG: hypothetical protein J7J11_01620 [Desulfurococcales archaeon]|nr:hypothetical protein [Desulfurococcales archaeon]
MTAECVFIINLQNVRKQPEEVCQLIKNKFNELLNFGYSKFKFIVVTGRDLRDWIDYVRCIIEYNISATITIDQVHELSEEVAGNAASVSDFLLIKT